MRLDEIQVGETYRFKYEPRPGKVLSIDRVPEYGNIGRMVRKLLVAFPPTQTEVERYIPAREAIELQSDHEARERDREARLAPIREAEERLVNALNRVGNDYRLSASQGHPFNRTHLYFNRLQAVIDLAEVIELGMRERQIREAIETNQAMEIGVLASQADAYRRGEDPREANLNRALHGTRAEVRKEES